MTPGTLTWDTARAGGMVAYALLSASVIVGLALSLGWRSPRWTRFVTNETHRFLTLLALVFTAIHGVAVTVDPFIRFSLPEVLVPFVSHYRPLWVGLGIVGAYLLAAVYASEWIRPRIGYAWWRRFHGVAFLVYILATIHGLGTGSDTRTPWAVLVYGSSIILVGALLVTRLLPSPPAMARPRLVALCGILLMGGTLWAWTGPMQAGWNVIANNGNGPGGVVPTTAADATGAGDATSSPTASPVPSAFTVGFSGTLAPGAANGQQTLTLDGTLDGAPSGSFELVLTGNESGEVSGGNLSLSTSDGLVCNGPLTRANREGIAVLCADGSGGQWLVTVQARSSSDGSVQGNLIVQPGTEGLGPNPDTSV